MVVRVGGGDEEEETEGDGSRHRDAGRDYHEDEEGSRRPLGAWG